MEASRPPIPARALCRAPMVAHLDCHIHATGVPRRACSVGRRAWARPVGAPATGRSRPHCAAGTRARVPSLCATPAHAVGTSPTSAIESDSAESVGAGLQQCINGITHSPATAVEPNRHRLEERREGVRGGGGHDSGCSTPSTHTSSRGPKSLWQRMGAGGRVGECYAKTSTQAGGRGGRWVCQLCSPPDL